MRIELVNTGTELLLGDTINTNAAWIGQQLAAHGLAVARQTVVPDGAVIREAIEEAARRCEVVLVSGGLGPTNDDLTRECAAELLGLPMELDAGVLEHLEAYFSKRNKPVSEATKRQAMVPRGAVVLPNPLGTAPGLFFPPELGAARGLPAAIFLLPGPPRELKPMVEGEVEPRLLLMMPERRGRRVLYLKITGLGESDIVERVEAALESIAGLELGYCIGRGDVDVRLAGEVAAVETGAAVVRQSMGDYIVSEDRRIIEEEVVALLKERGERVATAESCSGGMIANRITDVSGASDVFGHGFITYANEAKQAALGVPEALLKAHGAVSEPVARAMAEGCLRAAGAHHALAVTGIAGPTGGSPEKPVGTVFMALASSGAATEVRKLCFPGTRERFKLLASQAALEMLRRRLRGIAIV